MLQYQLDPIWNQLSAKTRQLVADIKTLRSVLRLVYVANDFIDYGYHFFSVNNILIYVNRCLTQYDCVTFNSLVASLRSTEYARRNSGWLLLDPAEDLFLLARQRVCGQITNDTEVDPEHSPKWVALSEILGEVQLKLKSIDPCDAPQGVNHILVLVEDTRTGNQLKEVQYYRIICIQVELLYYL